ncbi:hypothetical protein NE237_020940 [Protea cynaroides]|uniref:Uncharacterized protein n=1 Tax=Protea cynaroides TaxID=273540 RepID=A0A9Q0HAC0_9MAGN|nr:hypothetical protein NE237_020940 [Protea cynaroides]
MTDLKLKLLLSCRSDAVETKKGYFGYTFCSSCCVGGVRGIWYLYVWWGVDLLDMIEFVGECRDTDYEGLFCGAHKTVILKGVCSSAHALLHSNGNYPLEDVPIQIHLQLQCLVVLCSIRPNPLPSQILNFILKLGSLVPSQTKRLWFSI